jgi:hydrogenase expression/formation protein HypE
MLRGILFDFDGTLTEPGSLDFEAIRQAIGCPAGEPILEFIEKISSPEEKAGARKTLDRFETDAACRSRPNAGAEELIRFIHRRRLKIGLITRNSLNSVIRALANFETTAVSDFDVIISRDDSFAPKPSPDALCEAARRLGLSMREILTVGDYVFDIEAGHRAGTLTALITNGRAPHVCRNPPDYTIDGLPELEKIIDDLFPLPMGKLPNKLLGQYLSNLRQGTSALLIGPRVGEDVAAADVAGEDVLVLKSDPVTFATDRIGHYAVAVNTNDIATSGAVPKWLLATLLFPVGACPRQIREVMTELYEAARCHGMILCGGHTEITDAVTRPVVVAQVAGTVPRGLLIDKRKMKRGDRLLLTKGIAIEGTCIIAREFARELQRRGADPGRIKSWQRLLDDPGIGVWKEARLAAESGRVTAMHDVTEGGLATALEELSSAGEHRIRVYPDKIPVLPETAEVCALLGIDPLGLIGSGSLLIVCEPEACDELGRSIESAGIRATWIGEILENGAGVETAGGETRGAGWPHFEVDELARIFRQLSEK